MYLRLSSSNSVPPEGYLVYYHSRISNKNILCLLFHFLDSLVHDHLPEFINEDADEKMQVNIKQKSSKNSAPYFVIFRKVSKQIFFIFVTAS